MDAIALVAERACTVLQRLRHKLNDAKIGYESVEGVHNFLIQHGGTRFRVQFTERTLIKKSPLDIEAAINKLVESVLCVTQTQPTQTSRNQVNSSQRQLSWPVSQDS